MGTAKAYSHWQVAFSACPGPGAGGCAASGCEGDVGAVPGDLLGEAAEFGEQGPVDPFAGDRQCPEWVVAAAAVRAEGEVGVQQVPPGGQARGRLVHNLPVSEPERFGAFAEPPARRLAFLGGDEVVAARGLLPRPA